jgi:hypothetical protein
MDSPHSLLIGFYTKVAPMPPQCDNHDEMMRRILEAESIAKLVVMRCERPGVAKGRETERKTKNASLLLNGAAACSHSIHNAGEARRRRSRVCSPGVL